MIVNKLTYWSKSKSEMCRMIMERKKNEDMDRIMYSEDFDGGLPKIRMSKIVAMVKW
jgi:hypothetical protein